MNQLCLSRTLLMKAILRRRLKLFKDNHVFQTSHRRRKALSSIDEDFRALILLCELYNICFVRENSTQLDLMGMKSSNGTLIRENFFLLLTTTQIPEQTSRIIDKGYMVQNRLKGTLSLGPTQLHAWIQSVTILFIFFFFLLAYQACGPSQYKRWVSCCILTSTPFLANVHQFDLLFPASSMLCMDV